VENKKDVLENIEEHIYAMVG